MLVNYVGSASRIKRSAASRRLFVALTESCSSRMVVDIGPECFDKFRRAFVVG